MALTPPRKSVELEDPGAHELGKSNTLTVWQFPNESNHYTIESSEGESDAFQDASEGQKTGSGPASPVPIMRVEKVDNDESYGEVPGTEAYKMRGKDAVPDEIEIVPDGRKSRSSSNFSTPQMSPVGPGESPVPKTVVEKVDPMSPSHGDVPGTAAFSRRRADAVPDEIRPIGDSDSHPDTSESHDPRRDISIPTTVVTKVDSNPSHGEVPGTAAYEIRTQDAEPDVVEKKGDVAG